MVSKWVIIPIYYHIPFIGWLQPICKPLILTSWDIQVGFPWISLLNHQHLGVTLQAKLSNFDQATRRPVMESDPMATAGRFSTVVVSEVVRKVVFLCFSCFGVVGLLCSFVLICFCCVGVCLSCFFCYFVG